MSSNMNMIFTLRRASETNPISTTMEFVPGMPSMLVIKQGTSRIEMSVSESSVFRYVLGEIQSINRIVGDLDKDKSDGDYDY